MIKVSRGIISLVDVVRDGSSIVFGQTTSNTFDIDIDNTNDWDWNHIDAYDDIYLVYGDSSY